MDDDRTQVWLLKTQPIQRVPALRAGPQDEAGVRRQAAWFISAVMLVILMLCAIPRGRSAEEVPAIPPVRSMAALVTDTSLTDSALPIPSQQAPAARLLSEPAQPLPDASRQRHLFDHIAPHAPIWQDAPVTDWWHMPSPGSAGPSVGGWVAQRAVTNAPAVTESAAAQP